MTSTARPTSLVRHRVAPLLLALALVLAGCGEEATDADVVVVGVGSTVEQQVLAALTVVALEHAGLSAELSPDLGDTLSLRRQARVGQIDLYWDYTGAAWALAFGQENPPADAHESFERVREQDLENDLVWLDPTAANATLAFFVQAGDLPSEAPNGMGWMAGKLSSEEGTLCVDNDFRHRPGGLPQLATEYYQMSLDRVRVVSTDEDEAIVGVRDGRCFAGLATATSGLAYRAGLARVGDELGVFPAFIVAPVARAEVLERLPALEMALEPIAEQLDTASLRRLNAEAVDTDPEALAREFLADVLPDGDVER